MRRAGWGERLLGVGLVAPVFAVVGLFVGLPVVAAVAYSFGHGDGLNSTLSGLAQNQHLSTQGWGTTAAYREVLGSASFRRDLWVTVWITLATVAGVLTLTWGIALYGRLSKTRLSRVLTALSVVPMFIPVVIGSYALLGFYSADGFLRTVLAQLGWSDGPILSYTLPGVLLGEIWVSLPFGVLMLTSGLNAVPDALIEASRDCGASMTRTVFSILVPLNLVPLVIVATFTGISVIGSFTVPYLTGPSAPNLLGPSMTHYFQAFNQAQQATVMAVVVFVLAGGIGAAYLWANLKASGRSGATR